MNSCPVCGGTGWRIVERAGVSAAEPCICRPQPEASPRPTIEQVSEGVLVMSEVIAFFPKTPLGLRVIADNIQRFVQDKAALDWFIQQALSRVSSWSDGGIPLLRALYATKYTPADGIAPTIVFPGSSPDELEAQAKVREAAENDQRHEAFKKAALAGPEEDREPFPLPKVKRIM